VTDTTTETTNSPNAKNLRGTADAPPQEGLLRSVCARVVQLAEASQVGPRVIRMSVSGISVEVEWPEPSGTALAAPPREEPTAVHGPGGGNREVSHIRAPSVGRFYHCPSPGARPFVTVGDTVEAGQQVGILEAMKLMMPIHADVTGIVEEILVPEASSVEFGEALVAVSPSPDSGGE
jgi:acetyl-CoA carboxylase biotin carboxyl carrier protein